MRTRSLVSGSLVFDKYDYRFRKEEKQRKDSQLVHFQFLASQVC